jgi:hypothetical protein
MWMTDSDMFFCVALAFARPFVLVYYIHYHMTLFSLSLPFFCHQMISLFLLAQPLDNILSVLFLLLVVETHPQTNVTASLPQPCVFGFFFDPVPV